MKNKLFLALAISIVAFACSKKLSEVTFEGGTAPVLTASRTGNIPLSFINKDQEALRFNWTNPDYKFSTGVSSQTVNYNLEFDTTGANFNTIKKGVRSFAGDLGVTLTQGDVNDIMLNQMGFAFNKTYNLEVRVVARANNTEGTVLYSNVLKFTATTFSIPPKVIPPGTEALGYSDGKLFITGSATPASWQCACGEPELLSQKFTQVSPTLYELTLQLTGGGSYLLLPVYGSWGAKYGFTGDGNANNASGDTFKKDGNDLKAPAATGLYKITVNFQTGNFTVTPA